MTDPRRVHRPAVAAGFTLLEVIVSTGIGVVVLGIVLTVLQVGGDGYGQAVRRIDANVEARAALRTLADDLAVSRYDDNFGVRTPEGQWPSNEVWFLALQPRAAQEPSKASGDLCFVYYYTEVTQPLEGDRGPFTRKLYRRLVSSAEVMERLKQDEDFDMPSPDPRAVEDEAVAFNVVQFLAEPLIRTAGGEDQAWKKGEQAPDLVRITLRVTDNETAALMKDRGDWEGGSELVDRLLGSGEGESGKRLRTFQMTVPFEH